jgi:hypothetical protein
MSIKSNRKHTEAILEALERDKEENRSSDENFTELTPDDVEAKLRDAKSPFLSGFGWTKAAPPGGRIELRVFIWNSESNPASNIYVHVWIGSGNVDPAVGTFLLNSDARFPRLTRPEYPGLEAGDPHPFPLPPGLERLDFDLRLPSSLEESAYLGNICLMQLASHDVGRYLGRGVFPFAVRADSPPGQREATLP